MKIDIPIARLLFQCMIFFALLESGCGVVHAIMERVRHALRAGTGKDANLPTRAVITLLVLTVSVFAAQGIGLVDLIAKGYRVISWVLGSRIFWAIYPTQRRRGRGSCSVRIKCLRDGAGFPPGWISLAI